MSTIAGHMPPLTALAGMARNAGKPPEQRMVFVATPGTVPPKELRRTSARAPQRTQARVSTMLVRTKFQCQPEDRGFHAAERRIPELLPQCHAIVASD